VTANGYTGQAIGIGDVDGLAAALAEKLDAEITGALDVAGPLNVGASVTINIGVDVNLYRAGANQLATDDSLAVGGTLLVYGSAEIQGSLLGAQVINSTFIIRKDDWSAAARFRSTGGAVDWDLSGTMVISSFAGTPEDSFAGTQTGLMRLRAGSGVTLAKLTEFGSNEYAGEQFVDGAAGVAALGAKNGLSNLRFCGYKGTAGAPTTGTWATGDLIMDSTKTWYRCTAGGTPGTWA
jgi:hypothetical protein